LDAAIKAQSKVVPCYSILHYYTGAHMHTK